MIRSPSEMRSKSMTARPTWCKRSRSSAWAGRSAGMEPGIGVGRVIGKAHTLGNEVPRIQDVECAVKPGRHGVFLRAGVVACAMHALLLGALATSVPER